MPELIKMKTGTISDLESQTGGQPNVSLDKGTIYFAVDTTKHIGKIVYDAPKGTNGVDRIVMSTQAEYADLAGGLAAGTPDKILLDSVEMNANNYSHPTTTAVTPAAVKVGNDEYGHVVLGNTLVASDVGAAASSHVHGNITNDGKIGTTTDYAVYTTTDGLLTAGTLKTDDPTASGTGITYIATVSQDSKGKITATKSTVRDASTSQSGVVSTGAQSFAGAKTFTDKVTIGTTSQTAAPTASITIHDTRDYTWTPTSLDKGVNWYFTQSNSPDTRKWWSIMHLTGWTGDYSAWELAGPSHNIDQRTTPLYVRSGRTTNGWGSWRKIYDTENKPSVSNHTYTPAGTIAVATNGAGATTTVSEITEWISNTPTAVTPNNVVTSTSATSVSVTNEVLTIPASVLTSSSTGPSATVTAGTSASLTSNGKTVKSGDASYVFTGTEATLTHTVS